MSFQTVAERLFCRPVWSSKLGDMQMFPTDGSENRMVEPKVEAAGIEPALDPPPIYAISREISDEVAFRLSGLIEGEGCFSVGRINAHKNTPTYNCSFRVKLRADDRAYLERLASAVGLGRLRDEAQRHQDGHNRRPAVVWVIETKGECMSLVNILDRAPLWSKKANDYEVWREAVIYWNYPCFDPDGRIVWDPMEEYREDLAGSKRYSEVV